VQVQLEDRDADRRGGPEERAPALRGSPEELAAELRRFAAEGISCVQVVVDPITVGSIERLGETLAALER